ncbi:MAG: V-type ATP synthase subunit I [Nanohaloarchaea archaeon]|nr:V-type ATP synthase subunit I [Candidatus Nanohaloarchaea archaeon]
MTKISVTGAKKDLENVINTLYRLEVLDIDDYDGELNTGKPSDEAEDISQLLVDLRSTISKLPKVEGHRKNLTIEELENELPQLDEKISDIEEEIASLERRISNVNDKKKFFKKLRGSGVNYEDLEGTENLDVFVGRIDRDILTSEAPNTQYDVFEGEKASVIFYHETEDKAFRDAINKASSIELTVPETELTGSIETVSYNLEDRKEELREAKKQKENELESLAEEWREGLENIESFLTERVEKAEAPLNFATTENTFIAYGWIPSERFAEVEEELADKTEGRIHVQKEEAEEEPPVKHDNNRFVQPFESLTDLVSVPRYNELDPSFMLLLTFPLFFGFMIGDAGYGLTTLAVFYLGYRMVPAARDIFKSLMYASISTIIFGLAFGDAFGFIIFGHDSVLASQFGLEVFSQIPILFHRAHELGTVFSIAAVIGVVHVNLGFLLGFYNEYSNHGFREAFLEKGSWIVLELAAALAILGMTGAAAVVGVLAVIMLYMGEGIEGVVEIPSLLSNVLSYLRIFGVSVAAVSLAKVVNGLADPLFQSGSLLGVGLGIFMLVVGHTFNTFIKILEGFLQGIRLHYVEMFGKFYEGGGKKYAPFGANSN